MRPARWIAGRRRGDKRRDKERTKEEESAKESGEEREQKEGTEKYRHASNIRMMIILMMAWFVGLPVDLQLDPAKAGAYRRYDDLHQWRARNVIESDDTEETKKAIEPPGDDGRYDPATAGTRRCSPIRSVVTRLGRFPMTSTATTPDSPDKEEESKEAEKKLLNKKEGEGEKTRAGNKKGQGKERPY